MSDAPKPKPVRAWAINYAGQIMPATAALRRADCIAAWEEQATPEWAEDWKCDWRPIRVRIVPEDDSNG